MRLTNIRRLLENFLDGRKRKESRTMEYDDAKNMLASLRDSQIHYISVVNRKHKGKSVRRLTREEALAFLEEHFNNCDVHHESFGNCNENEELHYFDLKTRGQRATMVYKINENVISVDNNIILSDF